MATGQRCHGPRRRVRPLPTPVAPTNQIPAGSHVALPALFVAYAPKAAGHSLLGILHPQLRSAPLPPLMLSVFAILAQKQTPRLPRARPVAPDRVPDQECRLPSL